MDEALVIPSHDDLTQECGWIQLNKYLYFTPRYHLSFSDEAQLDLRFGDILRTFHTTDFSETEILESFEEECTIADVTETTSSILLDNELSQKITGMITGSAKGPLYELTSEIGASLEQTIRSSVGQSIKSDRSISRKRKNTFTVSQKIKPGTDELQHAVAGYRRYSRKVFLHYIDFLFVEYRVAPLGLRKKKRNLPRPIRANHANRILMNLPLFKLYYWKPESKSSLLYTESQYKQLPKVQHADKVTLEKLNEEFRSRLPSTLYRPTLYKLSKIAFPLRWVDRKGSWTREELEKLELDEAQGSAWWFQYGPGKHKR